MKLIGYLSNGYPSIAESKERAIRYVKSGVDIIEADFPAADPYLDNDLLKARIAIARQNTTDYKVYMDAILDVQKELPEADIMINIYEDTILEIGIDEFTNFMKELGEDKLLLAGDRFPKVREELEARGFYASSFVTRSMTDEELKLAEQSNGFIYMQGFGEESEYSTKYPTLKDCVRKVRSLISPERKIYCGIGVHTPELLQEVYEAGCDGVFLGTVVLKKENNLEEQVKLIKKLRKIADGETSREGGEFND